MAILFLVHIGMHIQGTRVSTIDKQVLFVEMNMCSVQSTILRVVTNDDHECHTWCIIP